MVRGLIVTIGRTLDRAPFSRPAERSHGGPGAHDGLLSTSVALDALAAASGFFLPGRDRRGRRPRGVVLAVLPFRRRGTGVS